MKTIMMIIVMVLIAVSASAVTLDTIYTADGDDGKTSLISGAFKKSVLFSPGDTIGAWYFSSRLPNGTTLTMEFEYKYLGRTGDKTFELEKTHRTVDPTAKYINRNAQEIDRNKINMYLDTTTPYVLEGLDNIWNTKLVPGNYKCKDNERVLLKMIALKGNQLEAQIVLPACFTKAKK